MTSIRSQQLDLQAYIKDLGLTVHDQWINGSGHWCLDLEAPNGRREKFHTGLNGRGDKEKFAFKRDLKHWADANPPTVVAQALVKAIPAFKHVAKVAPPKAFVQDPKYPIFPTKEQAMTDTNKSPPDGKPARKLNRLDAGQSFRLCTLLQSMTDAELTNAVEVAKIVEPKLGFPVSSHNVTFSMEAIGRKLQSARGGPKVSESAQIRTLALAVSALYTKLGEPLPDEVKSLL
jgi:hypothetical protein